MKIIIDNNTIKLWYSNKHYNTYNRSMFMIGTRGDVITLNSGDKIISSVTYSDIETINGVAPTSLDNASSILEAAMLCGGTSGAGESATIVGKPSGGDFVTSYNSATSLDFDSMPASHPILIDEDIKSIIQINNSQEVVQTFTREEYAMVVTNPAGSTYRITIAEAVFATTDTFVVETNISVGGSLIQVEDSVHVSGGEGIMPLFVRKDARGTMVDADGDYSTAQVNDAGEVRYRDDDVNTILGTIGDVAAVAGNQTAQLNYIGGKIEDNRVLLTTIDADTSKIPTQGTAIMTGSTPVTFATDDTMFVALDTAIDVIAGDTTSLDAKEGTTGEAADIEGTRAAQLRYIGDNLGVWLESTAPALLVTASDIGASDGVYIDQGAEIDMGNKFNVLGLFVKFIVNDSTTNTIKVLSKRESAGADEFVLESAGDYIKTLGDASVNIFYEFETNALIPYIQIQSAAGTLGVVEGTLEIYIIKGRK